MPCPIDSTVRMNTLAGLLSLAETELFSELTIIPHWTLESANFIS